MELFIRTYSMNILTMKYLLCYNYVYTLWCGFLYTIQTNDLYS